MKTKTVFLKVSLAFLFCLFAVYDFLRIDATSHSASDTLRPLIIELVFAGFFLYLLFKIVEKKVLLR